MKFLKKIDATPTKRIYNAVIADYNLELAICELIDNALDGWVREGKKKALYIEIEIDERQKTITVKDNAGGIKESEMRLVISPGESKTTADDETIGIFGVGSKRAVVALAELVRIKSRYDTEKTLLLQYDKDWLASGEWEVELYEADIPNDPGTTLIELQGLRVDLHRKDIHDLKKRLSYTYGRFLRNVDVNIHINKGPLTTKHYEDWTYPPDFEPQHFVGTLEIGDGRVNYEIMCGLIKSLRGLETENNEEYGVYFYCNDRLIQRAVKTHDVGFVSGAGKAGLPHPTVQIVRVIVSLNGNSTLMPWNSSKSQINVNHPTFQAIKEKISDALTHYCKAARHFSSNGGWAETVFKYDFGKIKKTVLPEKTGLKTYLPPLPIVHRVKYGDSVKENNKALALSKPWITGLYEAVVATNEISKLRLTQRNRLILLILDSTLEIAFKEFLVNDSGIYYDDKKLANIFDKRHLVHSEVKSVPSVSITTEEWKRIEHFYKMRCALVHQRANLTVADEDIENFRDLTEKVLSHLFGISFSASP